ncbi:unnamed protein product [Miscanthus lutarioriparius]|uniref:PB1-like domain-containing protein n=1 Tax=Miscanthus lutarioriparius TaxID=422564 RepID=A0A811N1J7_9POAL|nr:unnamed protein product [Miscanthus lutarioriparius]
MDGKAEGHKHVQREMDRDEICFFDLIDLIEGSGYTLVDYLYYKRKDSLVVIEQDFDVMEMLNECESEKTHIQPHRGRGGRKKKKGLHVMHTEALYANEVEQHDDENQNTSGDGDEVPDKRKGTILTHVWDLLEGDRIVTKFLYPRSCEKWILKSIGRDWRKHKATLKNTLFNPKKKKYVLSRRCLDDIDEDQWKALTLSERNKISREMKKTTHTTGTKSYARWSEDMVELDNLLHTQLELAQNSEGGVAWEGDAVHQVLGEEKAGQVHRMGLLPVPKQVYGRKTYHFKDINIVSLDGSSSDVETHMLEEIRQLKEHSRMQDKVIEELKNNQRHHENQEATMVPMEIVLGVIITIVRIKRCFLKEREFTVLHPTRMMDSLSTGMDW